MPSHNSDEVHMDFDWIQIDLTRDFDLHRSLLGSAGALSVSQHPQTASGGSNSL
jgi:hypothetical protein